jgi:hypothetical protein
MCIWPWSNPVKKLKESLDEALITSKASTITQTDLQSMVNEIVEQAKNRPFYIKLYNKVYYMLYDFTWWVYRLFKPCHKKIRNTIPRRWVDSVELIRDVNFAFITEFVEDEIHITDWEHNDEYKKVFTFLKESYSYITEERQLLVDKKEKLLIEAFESNLKPYVERYGEHDLIETEIENRDTDILIKLMQYRQWLWS